MTKREGERCHKIITPAWYNLQMTPCYHYLLELFTNYVMIFFCFWFLLIFEIFFFRFFFHFWKLHKKNRYLSFFLYFKFDVFHVQPPLIYKIWFFYFLIFTHLNFFQSFQTYKNLEAISKPLQTSPNIGPLTCTHALKMQKPLE